MSPDASPDAPPPAGPPEGDAASDPRIARAEQRVAMLRELAELGMALTREMARRALAPPAEPEAPAARAAAGPRHDPADAFARLSRAVRLTLALEAKADEALTALRAGAAVLAAQTPLDPYGDDDDDADDRPPPRDYPSAWRNRIRDNVFDAINREVTDIYPAQEILDDLYERLTEGERYDAFVHRPLREAVEAICQDLGLHPDWSQWTDEGWPPPPQSGKRHAWERFWAPQRRRLQ
jgi:hypothetical protein